MKFKDKFPEHFADFLSGQYECIDRIELNPYYPTLLSGGRVRDWYRPLDGIDPGFNAPALMYMAGAMSKRVHS